jgi:hypothetical protein
MVFCFPKKNLMRNHCSWKMTILMNMSRRLNMILMSRFRWMICFLR